MSALSFHSRYSARNVILPSLTTDATVFAAAVADFVREHPARVVLPTADGAITALTPWREKLASLGCVLALAPDCALEVANDKDRTLAIARDLGIAYPATMVIHGIDDLPAGGRHVRLPLCAQADDLISARRVRTTAGGRGHQRGRSHHRDPDLPERRRGCSGPANGERPPGGSHPLHRRRRRPCGLRARG